EYNIGTIVHSVYKYFTTLAKQRGIKLEVEVPEEELLASVDKEALTKILSNLFANALKYARTYVYLHLSVDEKNEVFTISMSNDGNIVPIEMRENIFKAFVQYRDGKDIVSGTGIGLAMARYLAELHQGMLVMDRELDCNRFILSIPILHQTLPDDSEEQHKKPGYDDEDREVSDKDKREVASILVVEDNKDMLAFVFRQLSSLYHVLIAENGVEALDVLEQKSVDLIISDIMMPLMDGVELCKHLKQNLDYSHIPVILLTAKTNLESRIEGLEEGADAYIEKPFSMEYLRANVANLLSNRERLRRHFIEFPFIKADAMAQTKADEMFISKLNEYVLRHLDNTDLQIDDIADAMNMGRSNFYRKLKGILNMSPNEYLRLFRLKQAASILKEGTYGVVEVSYMVGFSTPSYFSSCFKKQFGVLPKDFISH
ncbi:response regulator, partial [Bacteroides xylanisolvens]